MPSRNLRLLSALPLLLGVLWILWPITRAHLQAVAVLDTVGNRPVPAVLSHFTEPVTVEERDLHLLDSDIRARLYTPVRNGQPDTAAPAMLVLHGVHHLGMNEPRMIAFARALASCGIRVLTPELPGINDYHVGKASIATIGDSALWLRSQDPAHRPVGVMGLSFSGGLALLAAADPRWHPAIRFVAAVGSQDSMNRVAAYYRTADAPRPDGTVQHLTPHEYGALVLEYQAVEDFVPSPADREPIRQVLRAHLYEDTASEQAARAHLTSAQLALALRIMKTTDPETQAELFRSEHLHAVEMASVSPHAALATLTTPVYLLHGEADNIIPAAETQWMAHTLPPATLQLALISPVLSHLDMDGKGPSTMDNLRFVHWFGLILNAAER